ncbi:SUKH-4 family immunity protein [Streptomyces misionensis]|uniref:SUKH-4 family immunity protein n=1 Tax=Streptomyces misionensis TaxID=67331 RepID=UPI00094464FB|nr:SUKH-4 family immunity protein [Streptomyces misionensis]
MVDLTDENWPSFAMVQIHGSSAGNPDWDGPDLTLEVPRAMVGATYRAADALTRGHGSLVRFGSTGLFGSILLDTVTGAVVKLERDAHHVSIVNSSLPNFVVVVRAVIERFPFYDSGSDDSEWMAAARAVEEIVRGVDPGAFIRDGFWETLVNDIEMGDFSTEDVLG